MSQQQPTPETEFAKMNDDKVALIATTVWNGRGARTGSGYLTKSAETDLLAHMARTGRAAAELARRLAAKAQEVKNLEAAAVETTAQVAALTEDIVTRDQALRDHAAAIESGSAERDRVLITFQNGLELASLIASAAGSQFSDVTVHSGDVRTIAEFNVNGVYCALTHGSGRTWQFRYGTLLHELDLMYLHDGIPTEPQLAGLRHYFRATRPAKPNRPNKDAGAGTSPRIRTVYIVVPPRTDPRAPFRHFGR